MKASGPAGAPGRGGTDDGRPRLVVASVQGRKSLPADRVTDLERVSRATFLSRDHTLTAEEATALFADAEVLAITPKVSPVIDEDFLEALPNLRGICLHATGYDFVDPAALRRRGITLSTLLEYSTRSVAEQTLGLLLALSSRLHLANDRSRGLVHHGTSLRGFEIAGRTLGIIGCGRIGGTLARLAQALDMATIAYDIDPKPVPGVTYVTRDELFERSDVVTLHCPLPFDASPLVGHDEIRSMLPGAVLLNSSRAALVDDEAVIAAIRDGHLRGYAVDDELIGGPEVEDLLTEGRILQTGHSAWWTDEVLDRGSHMWADAIEAMLLGRPTAVVDPTVAPSDALAQ